MGKPPRKGFKPKVTIDRSSFDEATDYDINIGEHAKSLEPSEDKFAIKNGKIRRKLHWKPRNAKPEKQREKKRKGGNKKSTPPLPPSFAKERQVSLLSVGSAGGDSLCTNHSMATSHSMATQAQSNRTNSKSTTSSGRKKASRGANDGSVKNQRRNTNSFDTIDNEGFFSTWKSSPKAKKLGSLSEEGRNNGTRLANDRSSHGHAMSDDLPSDRLAGHQQDAKDSLASFERPPRSRRQSTETSNRHPLDKNDNSSSDRSVLSNSDVDISWSPSSQVKTAPSSNAESNSNMSITPISPVKLDFEDNRETLSSSKDHDDAGSRMKLEVIQSADVQRKQGLAAIPMRRASSTPMFAEKGTNSIETAQLTRVYSLDEFNLSHLQEEEPSLLLMNRVSCQNSPGNPDSPEVQVEEGVLQDSKHTISHEFAYVTPYGLQQVPRKSSSGDERFDGEDFTSIGKSTSKGMIDSDSNERDNLRLHEEDKLNHETSAANEVDELDDIMDGPNSGFQAGSGLVATKRDFEKMPMLSPSHPTMKPDTVASEGRKRQSAPVDVDDVKFINAEKNLLAIQEMASEHLVYGEYEEALDVFVEILRAQVERYDYDHLRVGTALHNVGIVQQKLGYYHKVVQVSIQAIQIRRRFLGDCHPDVAVSLAQLGLAQLELKHYNLALRAFREALHIRRASYGAKHPKVSKVLNNIGCTLSQVSKHEGAKMAFEEALEIQRNALRSFTDEQDMPESETFDQLLLSSALSLANISASNLRMGQLDQAYISLEESLMIQQSVLGDDHPKVIHTIKSLEYIERRKKAMTSNLVSMPVIELNGDSEVETHLVESGGHMAPWNSTKEANLDLWDELARTVVETTACGGQRKTFEV